MQNETSSTSSKKQLSTWGQNKAGAFWIKKKGDGKTYLSGKITIKGEEIPFLIFKNDFQEGNTPHFHAYEVPTLEDRHSEE
mgnify:FL=1